MRRLAAALLLVVACSSVFAQAVAVSRMQTAISSLIQKKMAARGFAANDPRWGSTLGSAGSTLGAAAAVAVTVSVGAATAPAWVTTGIAIGMGVAVQLAVDGLVKWVFGSDGTVSKPGAANPYNVAGGYAPMAMWQVQTAMAPSLDGACAGYGTTLTGVCSGNGFTCKMSTRVVSNECHYIRKDTYESNGQTYENDLGSVGQRYPVTGCTGISLTASANVCPASNFPSEPATVYANPSAAVAALPPEEQAKPVNPAILADLANDAWQKAAAVPGYEGLPYNAADPVTQADVDVYRAANPDSYPTVGDVLAPQVAPSGGTAATPFSLPNTGAGSDAAPTSPTNPSTEPRENLGSDPNIGMPTLEAPPTVAMILDPIFNLFPSLRSFTVPQHQATCPTGTLHLFGGTQALSAHCDVLEGARPLLTAVMAFVWAFVALRITLSA